MMTKRIIIAVICIITALSFSGGSYFYISHKTKEMVSYLTTAEELYSEGENFAAEAGKALAIWDEVKGKFGVMIKHEDADELERCFITIGDYMENGSSEELFVAVASCKAALEVMLDGEMPKSENIF